MARSKMSLRRGQLGHRQQAGVVEAAQAPVPFADALDAQIEAEQRQSAADAGQGGHRPDVLAARLRRIRRRQDGAAQLVVGQVAVETGLAGDALVEPPRLLLPAERLVGAAEPVDPVGPGLHRLRHLLDGFMHHRPVERAQGGARLPGQLFLRERRAGGLGIPAERFRLMLEGRLPAELAVEIAAVGGGEFRPDLVPLLGGLLRVVAGQPLQGEERHLPALTAGREVVGQQRQVAQRLVGDGLQGLRRRRLAGGR
jgi:hypothetical protein